jgi:hypothetical protein
VEKWRNEVLSYNVWIDKIILVVYDNYIMIKINNLSDDDTNVRSQITLGVKLRNLVRDKAKEKGVSFAEYLRRALMLSIALDREDDEDLVVLADRVVGSVDLKKHKEWETEAKVCNWVRGLRKEWERN